MTSAPAGATFHSGNSSDAAGSRGAGRRREGVQWLPVDVLVERDSGTQWPYVPAVTSSSAITSWKTFGYGYSWGRGYYGTPWVDVYSSTLSTPRYVRIVFTDSTRTKRSQIDWGINCWNSSGTSFWSRGANGNYSLPKTITWDPPSWVSRCEVNGLASHTDTGLLKITMQARY